MAQTQESTEGQKVTKLHRRNTAEQNKKVKERALWDSAEVKQFRESIKRQFKLDMRDEKKFPVSDPDFSWGMFKEKMMRETNSASANPQLLRAGVQAAVNNLYTGIPTTYEKWAHVIQSKKDTELYAPLNALSFLQEIGVGEKYPEGNVVGLDIKLRNKKYGEMFPVEMELIDDDQTGQFAQKVGEMTEYAALLFEVLAYGKLQSAGSANYGGLLVPASETKPSYEATYPWNTTGLKGGAITALTPAAMTQGAVQSAMTQLEEQLNLQGLKMNALGNQILCGPYYRWTLSTLLNSNFYPSGAAAAGAVGGSLAANVLEGIAEPVISRFMFDQNGASSNSKAWYVVDSSKPWFIIQMREAATVIQENPGSGADFERDVQRYKLRCRGNADFIEPRFAVRGSDGSA